MKNSNSPIHCESAYVNRGTAMPANPQPAFSLRAALIICATTVALSGCLIEGGGSSGSVQQELQEALNKQGSSGTSRETGSTGGTGESGGELPPEVAALITGNALADHYPGTVNYGKEVTLPSCDASDALRISTVAGLAQIENSSYRVFCIQPGDYRSYGTLAIGATSGTEDAPKVIRLENTALADSDEIFTVNMSQMARMPAVDIRNTSHWILNRLTWDNTSGMPIRMAGAEDIVIDRIRLENNSRGIEFQHGTHDSYIQNSYIGAQVIPQGSGNDGVCIAFIGHYRQVNLGGNIDYSYAVVARGNHIVNNEIFNCNDGIQAVWMPQYAIEPSFPGTVMAGNDIYIDSRVYTNCYGALDSNGLCAYTENAIDLKAGSLDASDPMLIFDNKMWGWRDTDSAYNTPANSHGTAISTHFNPVQNVQIYENIMWDIPSAVGFTRGSKDSIIRDNIIKDVTGEGHNSGIGIVIYSDPYDYDAPGDYGNVSGMTVEKNHIINTDAPWLSMSATNTSVSCNVVANGGDWTALTGPWATGVTTGNSTYYNTNPGGLSNGSDSIHTSFDSANMGELCFNVKNASVSGGEEVCLSDVLHSPNSPNVCASDYWTTDNW